MKSRAFNFRCGWLVGVGWLWLGAMAWAQVPVARAPHLQVRVKRGATPLITLKAAGTPLQQITGQLSAQLKVPIHLSPLLRKQTPELDFTDWTLENIARHLAPVVYADTATPTDGSPARLLALYLQGVNEPLPALEASLPNPAGAVIIEGSTEDEPVTPVRDKEELDTKAPLDVLYRDGLLALHAHEQPLRVVLAALAARLNVSCDIQQAAAERITLTINASLPIDVLHKLSPRLVLYLRHDWQRGEQLLLRIVTASPPLTSSSEEAKNK